MPPITIHPRLRPQMPREKLLRLLKRNGVEPDFTLHPLYIIGVRGYYLDTMGEPGVNDRRLYDDAIFLLTADAYHRFNGNTDPGGYRPGRGFSEKEKGMACLKPGVWVAYRFGRHKGRPAIIQGASVTVIRDGLDGDYPHSGWHGINIHKGQVHRVSSIGCTTVPPAQWEEFLDTATRLARRHLGARYNEILLPYVVVENRPETNG